MSNKENAIDVEVTERNLKELNIFQRMLEITNELGTVAKNLNVAITKNNQYKAVGEVDILNAVKPLEAKYGVYSYPHETEIVQQDLITTYTTYNNQRNERQQFLIRLERVYRFVNVDKPSEYVEVKSYGDGLDTGDKATGKAMTYADKYALMKAYKISTGDDPDQDASEEVQAKPKNAGNATDKQIGMIRNLYTEAQIEEMLERMGKPGLMHLTLQEASKMIEARKK